MKFLRDKSIFLLFFIGVLTRLFALFYTRGYLHPDNLFQLVEPAHRLVFGYGIVTWEYSLGARSWFQSILVAAIFKLGLFLGVNDISELIFFNRLVVAAASVVLLYVIYEVALAFYGRGAGWYSLFFSVFSGLLWLWSADVSSHVFAAVYSLVAVLLFYLACEGDLRRGYLFSGMSLGVAFIFRFDSVLFIIPFIFYALLVRSFLANMFFFFLGFGLLFLVQGILDYFIWGSFIHSPLVFFTQNLITAVSLNFGTQPYYYYLGVLGLHLTCLMVIPFAFERRRSMFFLSLNAAFFIVVYSLVAHKEPRFIITALPMVFILAGRGMERAVAAYGRVFMHLTLFSTVVLAMFVSFGFGWGDNSDVCAAMNYVGRQEDLSAVAYSSTWWQNGGYTYLHSPVPQIYVGEVALGPGLEWIDCSESSMDYLGFQCSPLHSVLSERRINYVVAGNGLLGAELTRGGFVRVAVFGDAEVYKRI